MTVEAEVAALRRSEKRAEELEKDRDAVLASLTDLLPVALDELSGRSATRSTVRCGLRLSPLRRAMRLLISRLISSLVQPSTLSP